MLDPYVPIDVHDRRACCKVVIEKRKDCSTCKHEGKNCYCLHPDPHVSMSYLFCVDKGYKHWEAI